MNFRQYDVDKFKFLLCFHLLFLLLEVISQTTSNFEHCETNFIMNIDIVGECFLCFAGKLDVGACKMNQYSSRPLWNTSTTGMI